MTDSFAGLLVNLHMIGFGKFLALWSGTRCAIYMHSFIPRPQGATNERIARHIEQGRQLVAKTKLELLNRSNTR